MPRQVRQAKAAIPFSKQSEHKCWVFVPIGRTERNAYHQCGNHQRPDKLTCKAHDALEEAAQALKRDAVAHMHNTRRIA